MNPGELQEEEKKKSVCVCLCACLQSDPTFNSLWPAGSMEKTTEFLIAPMYE